jgi:AbrB family looped-hinge helix DNA binding protein
MMLETYATTKGQIVIPSSIRRKLGIIEGTRIQIEVDEKENRIILTPVTRARMQKLFGLYKSTDLLGALAEDKAIERER